MKLALIPPIDLLDWTCETDMQLMLPHLVHDERYRYTYMAHCKDPFQYVILDNGAAEGEELAMYRLIEIAEEFGVDELVIPDTIGDMLDTQDKAEYFLDMWYLVEQRWTRDRRPKLMYVVQGKTFDELKQSAAYAIEDPRIDVIGIPRHILTSLHDHAGDRRKKLSVWIADRCDKPIHLLGANSKFPTELKQNGHWPKTVRSTDTSSPFNYAFQDKLLRAGMDCPRPEGYFDLPARVFVEDKLKRNVDYLKEWAGA